MTMEAELKRESIVFATIDLINEMGIQAVSTREVARRLNISQGTVFQYFPKKNDLLYAVLEHFSLYDNDVFSTTRLKNMKARAAIIFSIDSFLMYYENYPAMTAVIQAYDILRDVPGLGEKVKSIYENRRGYMQRLVEEAQAEGIIRTSADKEIIADIILSTFRGICLRWRIYGFSFSLREQTLVAINILLDAFGTEAAK